MKRIVIALAAALAATTTGAALAAQAQTDTGRLWVSATHTEGEDLYVAGDVRSRLYGRGAIVYVTRVSPGSSGSVVVRARKITVFFPNGTFVGTGQATQTTEGAMVSVSDGRFSLRGTGRYRGKRMTGTFSGTFTAGIYTFDYRATVR